VSTHCGFAEIGNRTGVEQWEKMQAVGVRIGNRCECTKKDVERINKPEKY